MEKQKLIYLLKSFSEIKFSQACIDCLNSDCLVNYDKEPFNRNKQIEILSKRNKSARRSNLQGVTELLFQLENASYDSVLIIKLATENVSYSIYISYDWKFVTGILFNPNMSKDKYLSLNREYEKRGLSISKWEDLN